MRVIWGGVLLFSLAGCQSYGPPEPGQAIALLAPTLRGKFACYVVPSAFYVPGTVIRIEADPANPTRQKPGAEPIVSFRSPIQTVESQTFAQKWLLDWEDKTIDGSLALRLLGSSFQIGKESEAKLTGSRGISVKAHLENVRELLLYDDARGQIRKAFQAHIDEIQPNYLYFWIKGALLPEKVHFWVRPSDGAELALPVTVGSSRVSLTLKSGRSGTGEVVAGAVINCIHPQQLEVSKTDQFIGAPSVEIKFKDLSSPAEAPFGALRVQ